MIHARSVQSVVYLERHVVSFEYFVSLFNRNNQFYFRVLRGREGCIRGLGIWAEQFRKCEIGGELSVGSWMI